MSVKRERGRVRWFKADKGYGRIAPDEFGDFLFVRFSSIAGEGFRACDVNRRNACHS